jgi:cytochrome c oxidase assembly protein subunit 15
VRALSGLNGSNPGGQQGSSLWHDPVPAPLRRLALLVALVWFAQAALGGWVSTNGAVLACEDFPTCHGQWWPAADWPTAFTLMRPLGSDGQGGAISLQALTAIHLMHRVGALVATTAVLLLAWRCWHMASPASRRDARCLLGLLAWQLLSGLTNVVLDWPLLAALAHTTGAALMVAFLTRMAVVPAVRTAEAPRCAPVPLNLTPKGA